MTDYRVRHLVLAKGAAVGVIALNIPGLVAGLIAIIGTAVLLLAYPLVVALSNSAHGFARFGDPRRHPERPISASHRAPAPGGPGHPQRSS